MMIDHKNCAVLVVEDDADVRHAVTESLRDEGYRVFEASDGKDALELLRSGGVQVSELSLISSTS